MNGSGEQSLFFVSLPDLRKLCCVTLSFQSQSDEGELRNKQVKTCRELLFLYPDIVASPVLGSFGGITVIMAITFFKRGIVQAYTQRHNLQMGAPQRVLPGALQTCLSYSLTARLAPDWNKAGQFLIGGKDFLSDSGKLKAIVMELSANESQLCVSVEASTVRLPPATLEDFDIPPLVARNFLIQRDAVMHTSMPSNWCFILPSMKRGQIISVSHSMPPECPFQSYAELRKHWSSLYGYQLPPVNEEDVIYCSVYFKLVGERLFTYPLSCIRTQPVQRFPRVDLQGALGSFLSDLRGTLESVCGFPARMTRKPCYHTASLARPGAQGSGNRPVNLTTKTTTRPVLTQLPSSCSQKLSSAGGTLLAPPLSQPGAQSGSSHYSRAGERESVQTSRPNVEIPLGRATERSWLSSNSSFSTPSSTDPLSASRPLHSQARSAPLGPKLVPIFKNKALPRHVNVTKILAERQQRRGEEQRLCAAKRPLSSSLASCSSSPPSFSSGWRQEPQHPAPTALPPPFCRPPMERVPLPVSKGVTAGLPQRPFTHQQPLAPAEIPSNRGGDLFESKPKKVKPNVQEVDVEKYARSNQLAKINAATLQVWLKSRGVAVRSKDRKEELVSKVMHCLSEP